MSKNTLKVEHDVHIHIENVRVSRWFFVLLFSIYSITYMTKGCFSGSLADIVAEGVLTKSETGLISAVFYMIYTPMQIVGGVVADKYNPERLIKIGLLGGALCNAVIFFNQNYYVMLITWAINAVVQFGIWPSIFKIMTSQLYPGDRTEMIFIMSLTVTVGLLGTFVLAAVVPGWEYNFAVSAALLLLCALMLHFADRRVNKYVVDDADTEKSQRAEAAPLLINTGESTASLFWRSGFILMLVPAFVRSAVGQSVKSISPTFIMETFDVTPSTSNLLNILIIIFGVVGTVSVRFGLKGRVKNEVVGIITFMLPALLLAIALLCTSTLWVTMVLLCALALTTTAPSLLISYFNSQFAKYGKNATAAGISNAASSFGVCIASYIYPLLADCMGWTAVIVAWAAFMLVSIAVLAITLPISLKFAKDESAIGSQQIV